MIPNLDTVQSIHDHGKLLIQVSRVQMVRGLKHDLDRLERQAMKHKSTPLYQIDTTTDDRQTGGGAAWVLIALGAALACVVGMALVGIVAR